MSARYLPPGMEYTAEAYEMLIDWWLARLNGAEFAVALYIARRTIGFGKATDRISLSQFQRGIKRKRDGQGVDVGTGLSRRAVVAAIRELVETGVIVEHKGGRNEPNEYGLDWELIDSQKGTRAESSLLGRAESSPEVGQKVHPQLSDNSQGIQLSGKDGSRLPGDANASPGAPYLPELLGLIDGTLGRHVSMNQFSRVLEAAGSMPESEMIATLETALQRSKTRPRTIRWFSAVLAEHRSFINGLKPAVPAAKEYGLTEQEFEGGANAF